MEPKFRVYSDLPGHTAAGGGSIPPELCVTTLKPDIVILNDQAKTIHLFELTCPSETNIEQRHTEKSNKYAHFTTDISDYKCKVDAFEVSSKGFLSTRNHTTLATLHKFINPAIKLQHIKRTSLHSHWRPPTTSSTASPSLPLWNHHSSCHPSSPNSAV